MFKSFAVFITFLLTVPFAYGQGGEGGTFDGIATQSAMSPSGGLSDSHGQTIYSVGSISFKKNELLASFRVDGLYNLVGLDYGAVCVALSGQLAESYR